ncbi:hypothetical protein IGI04_000578, partial [Brassica rapa subsp. trilocularis]
DFFLSVLPKVLELLTKSSCWVTVDDYQLFLRTIALGIKVKFLHGVLHLAELDSPLIGFISRFGLSMPEMNALFMVTY